LTSDRAPDSVEGGRAEENRIMDKTLLSRQHEERFRCPQCDQIVTVTTTYRKEETGDTLVQFDCNLRAVCGSPLWDPCPMYVAHVERPQANPS
jgi:transcription elongation factor Elf1